MSINFQSSETRVNLMRAFAGESQARNRYTFAAETAKKEQLPVIEAVFQFTADQERAHAEIFYQHLKPMNGKSVGIDGTYPVGAYTQTLDLLRSAAHNEFEEFDPVYPAFAKTAAEEGFLEVSSSFTLIAQIEQTHGKRFQMLAEWMEKNQLFISNIKTQWMCLNCGHIHDGSEAPRSCPVCQHPQGYFIRLELAPFASTGQPC